MVKSKKKCPQCNEPLERLYNRWAKSYLRPFGYACRNCFTIFRGKHLEIVFKTKSGWEVDIIKEKRKCNK